VCDALISNFDQLADRTINPSWSSTAEAAAWKLTDRAERRGARSMGTEPQSVRVPEAERRTLYAHQEGFPVQP